MDPRQALRELGGIGLAADVIAFSSRWEVDEALRAGEIARVARGRYALPTAKPARHAAAGLAGVVSHLSAAQLYGWEVLDVAEQPWVTVSRNRRLTAGQRESATVCYGSTTAGVTDGVTDPLRTVLDCARRLPFREALAVADSALRHRAIDAEHLRAAARDLHGPGARQARRVATHADGRAHNGLESALRALALDVPGLRLVPQLEIDLGHFKVHPDLVDPRLRLVIEAEGWLAHGSTRERFNQDLERYTLLGLDRWLVLRFGREAILDRPADVCAQLMAGAALARQFRRGSWLSDARAPVSRAATNPSGG